MDTVIARSARHMWTAFRTPAGVAVLNVAEPGGTDGRVATLVIAEDDVDALMRADLATSRVEALLGTAVRLPVALATPPISRYERLAA